MQNNYNNYEKVEKEVTYAGFWVRAAAYFIDSVIVFAGLLIVRLLLTVLLSVAEGTMLGGNILFHYTLKDILLYVCQVCYFILCTYYTGTTLGKKAMNLRVVSAEDGGKLTFLNVVYRETVGRFLCSLPVGIGYLIAGLDGEKRGIHDMLCDTRVVYIKKVKILPVYQPILRESPVPGSAGRGEMTGNPGSAGRAETAGNPGSAGRTEMTGNPGSAGRTEMTGNPGSAGRTEMIGTPENEAAPGTAERRYGGPYRLVRPEASWPEGSKKEEPKEEGPKEERPKEERPKEEGAKEEGAKREEESGK